MRALFDLVHPAHALFFANTIRALKAEGHPVCIASRKKDVLADVLESLGFEHELLTTPRPTLAGQAVELIERDWKLWRLAKEFKPDVLAGFGGLNVSHVGKLIGKPSLSFYDTEHAGLQLSLTIPFIDEWHVPESWTGPEPRGRTYRFPRCKQFAYFHRDYFKPDREIARSVGWDEQRDNFLIRVVAWQANHDHGRNGIPYTQLADIVSALSNRGKVHISAEGALPERFEPLRYRGPPASLHHLMGLCRLYCGESITMAVEATAMGVPVLLQIDKEYAYITEQEDAGLVTRFGPTENMETKLDHVLSTSHEEFRAKARQFADAAVDLNQYVMNALTRAAGHAPIDVRQALEPAEGPATLAK